MNTHMAFDRPLRIAFIGAGQMARNHLSAIQRLPVAVSIVGVTDRVAKIADQFAALAGVRPSFSIETLLEWAERDEVTGADPGAPAELAE